MTNWSENDKEWHERMYGRPQPPEQPEPQRPRRNFGESVARFDDGLANVHKHVKRTRQFAVAVVITALVLAASVVFIVAALDGWFKKLLWIILIGGIVCGFLYYRLNKLWNQYFGRR